MKKTLAIVLALVMVLALVACSGKTGTETPAPQTGTETKTEVLHATGLTGVEITTANFTDPVFREYVKTYDTEPTGGDNFLQTSELEGVLSMDISGKGIVRLRGIEHHGHAVGMRRRDDPPHVRDHAGHVRGVRADHEIAGLGEKRLERTVVEGAVAACGDEIDLDAPLSEGQIIKYKFREK